MSRARCLHFMIPCCDSWMWSTISFLIFWGTMGLEGHLLHNMLPEVKNTKYELRRKLAMKPKINTKRFMSSFINCLIFKYKLAVLFH